MWKLYGISGSFKIFKGTFQRNWINWEKMLGKIFFPAFNKLKKKYKEVQQQKKTCSGTFSFMKVKKFARY